MSHNLQAKTVKSMVQAKTGHAEHFDGLHEPCTTSSGHSERCQNPLCTNRVEPLENGWRRTERRFCKDDCRQHASLIRRVSELLKGQSDAEVLRIIRSQA